MIIDKINIVAYFKHFDGIVFAHWNILRKKCLMKRGKYVIIYIKYELLEI